VVGEAGSPVGVVGAVLGLSAVVLGAAADVVGAAPLCAEWAFCGPQPASTAIESAAVTVATATATGDLPRFLAVPVVPVILHPPDRCL
jgi:hypothetical protein